MRLLKHLLIFTLFSGLTIVYLFPLLQGLILLPLDLLISNYSPWYSPGTILLKNPYMQDSIIQLFPWRHLVFTSFQQGIIPFWNPYQMLGSPFMALIKPLVFYPFNLLFVFGEKTSWNLLLAGQIVLSMFFMYLLVRDFKIKLLPSIFAALAFALNSFMIGLLEFGSDAQTMVWWPLILLCTKRFLDTKNRLYLLGVGLSFALSILGGQLQYVGYFTFFLAAFVLWYGRTIKASVTKYILLALSLGLGVGVTAVQLLPSMELFSYSHRGLLSPAEQLTIFHDGLLQPVQLLRLFAPDFFGNPVSRDSSIGYIESGGYFGIIPLFFALFAAFFIRKQKIVQFLTITFVIAVLLSLQVIGELPFYLHLPLITSGTGSRIFTLVLFIGAFLSGFGLQAFSEEKDKKKHFFSLALFTAFFLCEIGFSRLNHLFTSTEVLLRSTKFAILILGGLLLISGAWLFVRIPRFQKTLTVGFLVLVVALTFFDLFRFGYRFLTFSNDKFIYPELPVVSFLHQATANSLGRVYGLTEPELGTYLAISSVDTYNPLFLVRTSQLLQALQRQPISAVNIYNKYLLTSLGTNLKYTLDTIGTEYVVAQKDENPAIKYFGSPNFENQFTKVYADDKYAVYQNTTAAKRFGLYYHYVTSPNDAATLTLLAQRKMNLNTSLILETKLPANLNPGTGTAKLIKNNINGQTFAVKTSTPALFYVSDAWYPGWQAIINNKPTKLYRANYNLRAVLVPAGTSTVSFTYLPTHFGLAVGATFGSLLVLLMLAIFPVLKKRQNNN